MKVLCVIPVLLGEEFVDALESVVKQTVKIDYVLLTFKKGPKVSKIGQKMSAVMNDALRKIRLKEFDYLLRVDTDMVLPQDFLEKNLKGNPDYVGNTAGAQIIRVSSFHKVFNGQFPLFSDDSYVIRKFKVEGYDVRAQYVVYPIFTRKGGSPHGSKYFVHRGLEQYRLGYTPIHIALSSMRLIKSGQLYGFFVALAYCFAWVFRVEKRDVFEWTRREQVKSIFQHLRKVFLRI